MTYNTKQKDIIIDLIKKQKKDFTIKDIYSKLDGKIGLSTIYRLIDRLESDGSVSRSLGKDNITYYQYLEKCKEENHFYLKCEKCGRLIHIDCECISDLTNHILVNHKFKMSKEHIIINGLCEACK